MQGTPFAAAIFASPARVIQRGGKKAVAFLLPIAEQEYTSFSVTTGNVWNASGGDGRKAGQVFPLNDALDVVLLGSFLFGLLFTAGTLLIGAVDAGIDHAAGHGADGNSISHLFNVSSLLAFVTWFGGLGFATRNVVGLPWFLALPIGLAGGVLAAIIVTAFIRKFLISADSDLDPSKYERVGVLARVTSSIRPGGVGEIVWEQEGTRMVTSARASDGEPIPRGTEVIVLKVERGVAMVEPFEGLLNS